MNNVIDELGEFFATKQQGMMELNSIDPEYPAKAIREGELYGVVIPYDNHEPIAERFANAQIHSRFINTDRSSDCYLALTCVSDSLRNEFATVCAQFVEPGRNGIARKSIINDPLQWWNNWRKLLGNADVEQQTYSVIGEMEALYHLYSNDKSVKWAASHSGTQDIENATESYEVKSSIRKYETQVTISSQNQLKKDNNRRLYLYFCRLEKSIQGDSINDMAGKLKSIGYPSGELELQLDHMGFEYGSSARNDKYRVIERRKYTVDEKFPVISDKSFVDGKMPEHVCKITYTIDLNGIDYVDW